MMTKRDMSGLVLRREAPADYRAVEELNREAFWNHFSPGCDEHYLMHILRDADCFIKELDIVAELDGQIVGNIAYTRARVVCDDGTSREVLSFGPLAVLPSFQGSGVGGRLVRHTMALAGELGYSAILIYGDPAYYSRLGFVPAERYGIGSADNMYADALQAVELTEGALSGAAGRFCEDEVYELDGVAAKAFDAGFPHKEWREGLPTQERFQMMVKLRRPRG